MDTTDPVNTSSATSDNNDDASTDPDLAASLGFTSFGGAPRPKRRKFNVHDTYIDPATASASKPPASKGDQGHGKGANATSLGVRGRSAARNENEALPLSDEDTIVPASTTSSTAAIIHDTQASIRASAPVPQHSPASPAILQLHSHARPGPQPNAHLASATDLAGLTPQDLQQLRAGVVMQNGDVAYFQPSFLEDPWEKLQRKGV